MEARIDIPDVLSYAGLDAALRGLEALAEAELLSQPFLPLYESGVIYQREPRGQERWLTPSQVVARGAADCEDLAAWRAAELRVSGEDPYAQAEVVQTSPLTWHAVVLRDGGWYEDPSAMLGMTSASGLVAPVSFLLEPGSERDYRARIAMNGLGWYDDIEAEDDDAAEALDAAVEGARASVLGAIPFVGPVLDIISDVANLATGRKPAPPPPAPAAPTPPVVTVAPQRPAAPRPAARPAARPKQPITLEQGVLDLALRLRRLAEGEQRRIAQREAKLRRALQTTVRR